MYPKIELHVHLEGTVRAATLLEIARRNDYALPADTVETLLKHKKRRSLRHRQGVTASRLTRPLCTGCATLLCVARPACADKLSK